MTTRKACAALVFLAAFSFCAIAADPPKWGGAADTPLKQAPGAMARTAAPSGQVQLSGLDSKLGVSLTGLPAFMQVSGSNVGIGAYFTMNPTSRLGVRVMTVNSNGTTAPAGTYRVRFNASNVGWAVPLTLTSGAQTATCTLQPQPGYRNIQLCDLVVTTGGQMFGVDARYSGTAPELTIDSIQVFKEK